MTKKSKASILVAMKHLCLDSSEQPPDDLIDETRLIGLNGNSLEFTMFPLKICY
jgi:hypothetical protein